MSTITLTITDNPPEEHEALGEVRLMMTFDPPLHDKFPETPAEIFAARLMEAIEEQVTVKHKEYIRRH